MTKDEEKTTEEKTEEKTEETSDEKETVVVKELPVQQVTIGFIGDKEVNLITTEDALTEIYQDIKLIKKAVA